MGGGGGYICGFLLPGSEDSEMPGEIFQELAYSAGWRREQFMYIHFFLGVLVV